MCGLGGLIGSIGTPEENIFRDLLLFNTARGADSTGAASVPRFKQDEISFFKTVGPASDLLRSTQFMKMMVPTHCVLLGHNRSMTRGTVKWRNAHPFVFDNTIGMHNGTLMNTSKLKDAHKFDTDSEAIFWNIDQQGVEKTIPLLDGAYTLVWYDVRAHAVNMIRNEQRPLYYTYREDGKVLAFGSEVGILRAACYRDYDRNWKSKDDKFWQLPVDTLMTWKIPEHTTDVLAEPERVKMEGYKRSVQQSYHQAHSFSQANRGGSGNSTQAPFRTPGTPSGGTRETTSTTGGTPSESGVPDRTTVVGPRPASAGNPAKIVAVPGKALFTVEQTGDFKGWHCYVTQPGYRVYRDPERNCWVECSWNDLTKDWNRTVRKFAPQSVSIPPLHKGDHKWKHKGKKKRKQIFFRGFGGTDLNEIEFESLMSFKCQACHREPQWGHDVTFLNEHHDFLCGLCALDKPLVEQWRKAI